MSDPAVKLIISLGDGVALYGPVGPDYSDFTVQVDGGPRRSLTATRSMYVPQTMLVRADNLGEGSHQVKLQYQPARAGQLLAVDFATVYKTGSVSGK